MIGACVPGFVTWSPLAFTVSGTVTWLLRSLSIPHVFIVLTLNSVTLPQHSSISGEYGVSDVTTSRSGTPVLSTPAPLQALQVTMLLDKTCTSTCTCTSTSTAICTSVLDAVTTKLSVKVTNTGCVSSVTAVSECSTDRRVCSSAD
jgi:hypothetical protein